MTIKQVTKHHIHLKFLSLKGGYTGSSESTLVIFLEIVATLLEISSRGASVSLISSDS